MSYNSNTYTYTSNGELATLEEGLFSKFKYTHDALGRLKEVLTPKGDRLSYILDWNGRRVAIAENGKQIATRIYEDQYRIAAEYNRKRNVIQEYVYSTSINSPDYMTERNARYKFIKDHLGSPRLIVHSMTGKIVQRLDYSEFGKVIIDTNQGFQPFGFAGGIRDPNTGLLKFGARDYGPTTGRWTSKDPTRFNGGDTNLYGYSAHDPVNWIDFSGETKNRPGNHRIPDAGGGGGVRGSLVLPKPPAKPQNCPGKGWEWRGKAPVGSNKELGTIRRQTRVYIRI